VPASEPGGLGRESGTGVYRKHIRSFSQTILALGKVAACSEFFPANNSVPNIIYFKI